jgi:pSer/pThr/pTyr-binding forkhead associated (FHA) protein
MLTTEPALQNGQLTELGVQGHLSGIYDTEANVAWNNIVLQEQPEPKVAPDIPQPLPQPEIAPEPQPEPKPQPETTPEEPNPQPAILPQPEPDIPQPLPEPTPPEKPASPPAQSDEPQARELPKVVPRLVITSQYLTEPREVALENELITVGRAGSSDILLDYDNLTSRHHAILKYDRDQYVIFDQRSAKGILVNGQRLTVGVGWRLTDGDCITIGAYTLVFHSCPP